MNPEICHIINGSVTDSVLYLMSIGISDVLVSLLPFCRPIRTPGPYCALTDSMIPVINRLHIYFLPYLYTPIRIGLFCFQAGGRKRQPNLTLVFLCLFHATDCLKNTQLNSTSFNGCRC